MSDRNEKISETSTADLRAENERLKKAAMSAADFIGDMKMTQRGDKIFRELNAALGGEAVRKYIEGVRS